MDPIDLLPSLTQLGAAGLIGWMWLSERRAAAAREQQLTELHDRLMAERSNTTALLAVVTDNTRALAALESAQRTTVTLLERLTIPSAPRRQGNPRRPRAPRD